MQQPLAKPVLPAGAIPKLFAVTLAILLAGCAVPQRINTAPPALRNAGPPVVIEDVDVLEVTPKMHRFLEQYVLGYDNDETRRQLLAMSLVSKSMLGFHYNLERTLTAEEAFNTRSGNCIGFANLFIAMAREAGLNARYHEIILPPEFMSRSDMLVNAKHITVVVTTARGPFQIDISGRISSFNESRRVLSDDEAKALFFNNLAMEKLFEGDLRTAHAYLLKAIETAPRVSDSWSNLGVVLVRNEQLDDAEIAYTTALQLDPTERSTLANLYELYMTQERFGLAEELKQRVERYRRENPYYLLAMSDEAIEQQNFEQSLDLLKRAIRKKENEHRLHFALAKTQYLSGRKDEAVDSLNRARELAPREIAMDYQRPLHELVQAPEHSGLR